MLIKEIQEVPSSTGVLLCFPLYFSFLVPAWLCTEYWMSWAFHSCQSKPIYHLPREYEPFHFAGIKEHLLIESRGLMEDESWWGRLLRHLLSALWTFFLWDHMHPQMHLHSRALHGPVWFCVTCVLWRPLLLQGSVVGRPQGIMAEKVHSTQYDTRRKPQREERLFGTQFQHWED